MRRVFVNCRSLCSVTNNTSLQTSGPTFRSSARHSPLKKTLNRTQAGLPEWLYFFHKALFSPSAGFRSSEGSGSCINAKICSSLLAATFGSVTLAGAGLLSEPAASESSQAGQNSNEIGNALSKGNLDTEKAMEQAKKGIEERIKFLNLSPSTLPPYTIAAKGQQVTIRAPISPVCDIWHLIVDVISRAGQFCKGLDNDKIFVSAVESAVALVLMIEHPDQPKEGQPEGDWQRDNDKQAGLASNDLYIWVFEPLIGEKFPEIEFIKRGFFSAAELDMVVSTLRIASGETTIDTPRQRYQRGREKQNLGGSGKKILDSLEAMGVKVYGLDTKAGSLNSEAISWDNIAGYHEQKREIEDTVLLALRRPEIYDSIARGTRRKFESNRPRAILFEGPPGTGKTSSARAIASQAGVPLLYVPLEVLMSKYYGESEGMLGKVFNLANDLPNGAIIFLDEIDSLATTRDREMHEATRRMLSVLLRQIDGFEQDTRIIVVAATNRKEDLDPALISRFDSSITFDLPDQHTREEIAAQYARHLSSAELASLAAISEGMSGRDLRDICQQAERHWASKLIRGLAGNPSSHGLPPIQEYIYCAEKRRLTMHKLSLEGKQSKVYNSSPKGWPSGKSVLV